jgi:hypothetical protein
MQPIIIDNFLPSYYMDLINETIKSPTFNWFYHESISGWDNKYTAEGINFLDNQQGFYHNILHEDSTSFIFDLIKPMFASIPSAFDIEIESIFRARLGFFIPNGQSGSHYPHVDYSFDHKVLLVYTEDSDGDTIIYDYKTEKEGDVPFFEDVKELKRITPKQGRVVVFDGLYWHTAEQPKKDVRCILNFNISTNGT